MMLFPAVLMISNLNFPNSKVCLIGEWSIVFLLVDLAKTQYTRDDELTIICINQHKNNDNENFSMFSRYIISPRW